MKRNTAARNKVRKWRQERGLSIEALALQLGYKGHAALARWETGDRALPVVRLLLLGKLVGLDPLDLCDPCQRVQLRILQESGA